jgi:hypothetical protein
MSGQRLASALVPWFRLERKISPDSVADKVGSEVVVSRASDDAAEVIDLGELELAS